MKLLRALVLLAAVAAASVAGARDKESGSSSGGGVTPAPATTAPVTRAPSPSPRLTPAPSTAAPAPGSGDGSDGSSSAGSSTPAPSSVAPTPSPKNNRTSSSNKTDEPVATVKTRASVVTALTPTPGDEGTTGAAALDSDSVNSEYGTKAPSSGDETEVSTSSSGGSSGGWMVPVIVGCVIVSALVVVTFYVRSKRRDDDDDDDDNVDDFQRRTNNFFQHPRTTNHNVQTIAHDPEPPLFKPKPEPSSVPLNAVSVQPATRSPRKFSIPMLQSPQRASGDSIDGRDTVSHHQAAAVANQQHNNFRVTSPNSLHDERISARFTSASMSGVTL